MKYLLFLIFFFPLTLHAQTNNQPQPLITSIETLPANQDPQRGVYLRGKVTIPVRPTESNTVHVWFRVRNIIEGSPTPWRAHGEKRLGPTNSSSFEAEYTGNLAGISGAPSDCLHLEYQALAQYQNRLQQFYNGPRYLSPNNYGGPVIRFEYTVISNANFSSANTPIGVAVGATQTFKGTRNCLAAPPSNVGELTPGSTRPPPNIGPGTEPIDEEVEGEVDNSSNTYTLITPLPLGGDSNTLIKDVQIGTGNILDLLNRLFILMIIAAIVLAVVFMIIGGARYATGDSLGGKLGGKEIITHAIQGLLFALLAWLLLNIVNPDLLRFTLELKNVGDVSTTRGTSQGGPGNSSGTPGGGGTEGKCDRCVPLTIQTNDRTCCSEYVNGACANDKIKTGNECKVYSGLLTNLNTLKSSVPSLTITEAWPPTITHANSCHKTGRCVDARPNNAGAVVTNDEFIKFVRGAKASNLLVQYETKDQADVNRLTSALPDDLRSACPNDKCVIKYNVPPHFSVYMKSSGSSGGSSSSGGLIQFENIGANDKGVWGKSSGRFQQVTPAQIKDMIKCTSLQKEAIRTAARAARVDYKVFRALIASESCGDGQAFNPNDPGVGACGISQTLVPTARAVDQTLERRFINQLSDVAVCTALRNDSAYSLKIGATYLATRPGSSMKAKLAGYNGGVGREGATGTSTNCPGLMRFECPWDSSGCYNKEKPNDKPTKTDCEINTGYEVTRFYVDKILKAVEQIKD